MSRSGPPGMPYTVRSGAPDATVAAAYRGALTALRERIHALCVDVVSDGSWPADVQWSVDRLEARRPARWSRWRRRWLEPSISVDLDPRDDDDFDLAVAVAPYTICGTGTDGRDRIVYDGNDTGTSAWFALTGEEHAAAVQYMATHGGEPQYLIPFTRR